MSKELQKVTEASDYISSKINVIPKFGMILGSGLGSFADQLESPTFIDFKDIPHFPESTVEGHSGRIVVGVMNGIPIMVLQGRFHYYEGYSMD